MGLIHLYSATSTSFDDNGTPLVTAREAVVKRDEGFQLTFSIPISQNELHKRVQKEMIVSAMTPDGVNYFRIWDIEKRTTDVKVTALQLLYSLDVKQINPFGGKQHTGDSVLQAFANSFKSSISPYTFSSSIVTSRDFYTNEEDDTSTSHNALAILNKIADNWSGELMLNGFDVRMVSKLGTKTDALLYEHKNIASFSDSSSMNGIVTRIYATATYTPERAEGATEDPEPVVLTSIVDSPLINQYAVIYEATMEYNDARTVNELRTEILKQYSEFNVDKPERTIDVDTNIVDGTAINFGDELVLKYLVHDVDEVIRCVGYEYDPISENYIGVTLGTLEKTFLTKVTEGISSSVSRQLEQLNKQIQVVQTAANGKNRVTYGPNPVPNAIEGDLWFYHPEGRPDEVELLVYQNGLWMPAPFLTDQDRADFDQAMTDHYDAALAEVARKDAEYKEIFDDYDEQVVAMDQEISDAATKAQSALEEAGISTDLAQTAKDLATTAQSSASAAIVSANQAKTEASTAVTNANQAKADASTAKTNAQTALDDAQTAITNAGTAATDASQAKEDAQTAITEAGQAVVSANTAKTNAQTALTDAQTALSTAKNADTRSGLAETAANTAKTNAQTALDNSSTAITNAADAITKAGQAETTANTAKTNAQTALDDAQLALTTAGSADTKAGQAIAKANAIPTTITDIIADRNLVNGSYVDTKVDDATGAWSQELVRVEGMIPLDTNDKNYLTNSETEWETTSFTSNSAYGVYRVGQDVTDTFRELVGQIKISVDVFIENAEREHTSLRIYGSNGSPRYTLSPLIIHDIKTNEWVRVSGMTEIVDKDTGGHGRIEIFGHSVASTTKIRIRKMKIGKPYSSDTWTPAPEDLYSQEEFKIFNAQYAQDVTGITGRLTTVETDKLDGSTFQTFKQSEYQVTADKVTSTIARVDTAEGKIATQGTAISQQATAIASKADKTVVDTLSGTVSAHGTLISQNATDISSKADSELVDDIKGTVDTHTTEISQNATDIASKASSTSVNALTGRVSTAETTISQHATAITSKASQTEVDTVKGTVSSHTTTLGQHATAISSKAESSLVDTIKDTVDTHTTDISQNATDIASKASSTSVNALTGRVSTAESNIGQNATAISQRVTTTTYNTGIASKENSVLKQSAAPSHLNGRLWLDTSVTPNILKRSTGTSWVKATPTTASEVGAYSSGQGSALAGRVTTAETNITQTATAIESKADQTEVDTVKGTVSGHTTTLSQHATAIASKAESSLVNTIKGTVDTHTTEISQNATAIASKASSSSVSTLTGRVSTAETTITQHGTSIASKASQTEVDTVKGTVASHTSTLSQHATQIGARLTSSQVNSLVDGKGFSTVNYVDNQITASASGIRADMSVVEGKIDNLQVGGRNLIKRRDFGNIVPSGVSGVAVLDEDYQNGLKATGGNNGRNNYIEFPDVLTGNGWYTVSFLARGTQGGTRGISVIIGGSPSITDGRISNTSNEYTYHTYSYEVENYNSETNNSIKIAELDYAYYRIDNIKLEKGSIATDWSPAPEDTMMENDFNIFKASYEATAQSLTSRLTAVDKVGGRLSTAETSISQNATAISSKANTSTVNTLTGRVSTAETKITQNATAITSKASQSEVNTVKGTVSGHTTTLSQHATAISSKAESSLVNTIKGTVDTHTTNISQNATAISSKASTSSVNTLTGRVSTAESTISQHATSIASKASQTEVDTVKGTVSGHTSTLSQHATQISARLTTAQVNSLVDGKGLAKVTYVDSQITATADGFSTELTKVEGKIDGLQFGVENLVLDSKKLINVNNNNGTWGLVKANAFKTSRKLEVGKVYTVTVKSRFGGYIPQLELWLQGTQQIIKIPYKAGTHVSTNTFTCTYETDGLHIYGQYLAKDVSFIEWVTIVEGNKGPADWVPATQDVLSQDEWTVWENNYTSTISGITTELSKTAKKTDLNGMVTESTLSTKNFVTAGSMTTTLTNYAQKNNVPTNTQFNSLKNSYDSMVQTIGTNGSKIAQMVMTDSLFQTNVQNNLGNTGNLVTNPDFEDGLNGWENLINVESNDENSPKKYYARHASRDAYNLRTFPVVEGQKYRISYYRWNGSTFNNETNIGLLYKTKDDVSIWQRAVVEQGRLNKGQVSAVVAVPANVVNARLWISINQYENFSPLFFTQASVELVPDGMAYHSQVTQLAGSWALTLKSGNDIKTQINASTNSIRLQSKFIHLSGTSLIDNAVIKSAHIDTLNANKITGNTADFNTIRTGVLTANAVRATHIHADTVFFDKLFSTTSATDRLSARDAWIKNANIISINADKITAGTISANRISTSSLNNVDLNTENLIRNSAVPQHGHEWQNKADATITRMVDGYEHLMSATPSAGNIFLGIGKNSLIPLEPNTYYVYSMWVFAGAIATVTANNPLHCWVAGGGSNSGGLAEEGKVLLSNGYLLANTWNRIVVRFKTNSRGDIKFTPMWYGTMYPNGIAVRVRNLQLEKGVKATDWRPSPYDTPSESKLARSGSVVIHGGNIKADTLDVGAITGNKATFISSGFKSLNSQSTINGHAIRIQNTAGEFVEMNNTPELRSDDAGGTAVVLGKGRVHFYDSRGHSKGYVGTDMHTAGSYDFGTFLSKGSGIYKFARMADATQTTYAYYTVKSGLTAPASVITNMVQNGYLPDGNPQQFVAKGNMLSQLNGWPNYPNWPTLKAGQQIRYKEVTSQTTGDAYEDIWKFGPSSQGDWRIYFAKHATFEGGTTGTSDRRLKHDIEPTQIEALGHIESLAFKEFKWNRDNKYEPLGLIAQDSGIVRVADDDMEGIDIQRAIMLGLKGIQELQEIVKEQAEEIRQLKEINNQ